MLTFEKISHDNDYELKIPLCSGITSEEARYTFFCEIFDDFSSRSNRNFLSVFDFQRVLSIPMIIAQKLFDSFSEEEGRQSNCKLSRREFSNGMSRLYFSSLECQLKSLYLMMNFDHITHQIIEEDLEIIFSHLHLMKYPSSQLNLLHEVIGNAFRTKKEFRDGVKEFEQFLCELNSDILVLWNVLFMEQCAFQEEHIIQFQNIHRSTIINVQVNNGVQITFAKPSEKLITYLRCIGYFQSNDSDPAFGELDRFEGDLEQILEAFSEISDDLHICKPWPCQRDSKNEINTSTTTQCTEYSVIVKDRNRVMTNKSTVCFVPKGRTKLKKCLLTISGNCVFVEKYSHGFLSYKKTILLNGIVIEECNEVVIDNTTYFPFQMKSTISKSKHVYYFLSTDAEERKRWMKLLQSELNYRNIEDYYTFAEIIGEGHFARIIKGIHKQTGIQTAMKIISKTSHNEEMLSWEIEIFKLLLNISHPGIIKALDMFETCTYVILIFEYMPDGDLESYFFSQNKEISVNVIKDFFSQLIEALSFLHGLGIIHRDLKLPNILIGHNIKKNEHILKITDFGLSKVIFKEELANECYGSVNYAAPEIIFNMPYNHSVDIWNLGIVMYFLIFGVFPFKDCNFQNEAIAQQVKKYINREKLFQMTSLNTNMSENYKIFSTVAECLKSECIKRPTIHFLKYEI